jgi:hypothetical protein
VRPVRSTAVALVAVTALVTACGDDGEPGADPTTSSSASPSEGSSPTETASPSVEPATGEKVVGLSYTARAPAGWKVRRGTTTAQLASMYAIDETPDGDVTGFLRVADGNAFVYDDPLHRLAQQRINSGEYQKLPKMLDNVAVDGVEMYHVAGNVGNGNYIIDLGAIVGKNLTEIHIESDDLTPEELQEVLDSVLATWQWA